MSNTSGDIDGFPYEILYCTKEIHTGFILLNFSVFLCLFLGTPAHSWLLWLSLHTGWKIKPNQVLPLILTVMDLLLCLHSSFEALSVFIIQNNVVAHGSRFIFGLCWGSRLQIQVCIYFEQYLAVIYPVTFLRYKAIQYRIAAAVTVWLMSSGYGLFLSVTKVEFPDYVLSSTCFIGLFVISFCCISVLRALRHPGPGGRETTKERGRDVGNQQKRNAFNAIFTVLLIVLFSYLPLALITIFRLTRINKKILYCEIVLIIVSFHIYVVVTPLLLKLCKEGHLKCIRNQKANQSG